MARIDNPLGVQLHIEILYNTFIGYFFNITRLVHLEQQ